MPCGTETLLDAILARLGVGESWFQYVAGQPAGDGWTNVADILAEPDVLDGWLADLLVGEAKGHRDVAASYLTSWLGGALAEPVAAAVLTDRSAWPVVADGLAVHRHPEGWFDGLAVQASIVRVVHGDARADHPDAEAVADIEGLRGGVARELVAVLAPLFAAVRARASIGTRGMWAAVADGIAANGLQRALRDGVDGQVAWREANLLLDALSAEVAVPVTRPALALVHWSGGVAHFAVRGTCCLYYKVSGEPRDPCGEAYCTSCPFRDDADRRRRWAAWLDEQARADEKPGAS